MGNGAHRGLRSQLSGPDLGGFSITSAPSLVSKTASFRGSELPPYHLKSPDHLGSTHSLVCLNCLPPTPLPPAPPQEKHKIINGKSFKCSLPGENGRNLEGPKHILVHIPAAEGHSVRTRVRMDRSVGSQGCLGQGAGRPWSGQGSQG